MTSSRLPLLAISPTASHSPFCFSGRKRVHDSETFTARIAVDRIVRHLGRSRLRCHEETAERRRRRQSRRQDSRLLEHFLFTLHRILRRRGSWRILGE